MSTFIQVRRHSANPDLHNAPVMIAVAHITAIVPNWNNGEEWTHTDIFTPDAKFSTQHLMDEIETAMRADIFTALVTD